MRDHGDEVIEFLRRAPHRSAEQRLQPLTELPPHGRAERLLGCYRGALQIVAILRLLYSTSALHEQYHRLRADCGVGANCWIAGSTSAV
jgi:hypothetical protein